MTEIARIYHYLPLTDHLLTSGQPTRGQFEAVAKSGVETVINLALETSDNALPDEAEVVRNLGMEYVHIPVIWEKPLRADLERFMQVMDAQKGRKLLVHCAANMRVSAFVALYRVLRQGWTWDKAMEDVRRIWDPDENPVWKEFVRAALQGE